MVQRSNTWMIFGFLALILYLLIFMNTYHLWAFAKGIISANSVAMPFIVLGLVFLLSIGVFHKKLLQANKPTTFWLIFFLVLTVVALVIPDPKSPLKRIHVAEYLLFTVLVRHLLSYRLSAYKLSIFTVLTAILFSIHDEMAQGLHPLRSYGIVDILVDTLSILGVGGLMHSMKLFDKSDLINKKNEEQVDNTSITKITFYFLILSVAILFLMFSLSAYKGQALPWWTLLPIITTSALWKYNLLSLKLPSDFQYGLKILYWLSIFYIFYPIAINILGWSFK